MLLRVSLPYDEFSVIYSLTVHFWTADWYSSRLALGQIDTTFRESHKRQCVYVYIQVYIYYVHVVLIVVLL